MTLGAHSYASYDLSQDYSPSSTYLLADYRRDIRPNSDVIYFKDLFPDLLQKWRLETMLLSSPADMREVDSFKDIVSYGWMAVPYIIEEVSQRPSLLFMALSEITGHDPITDPVRGNVGLMTGAWIAWFRKSKHEFF